MFNSLKTKYWFNSNKTGFDEFLNLQAFQRSKLFELKISLIMFMTLFDVFYLIWPYDSPHLRLRNSALLHHKITVARLSHYGLRHQSSVWKPTFQLKVILHPALYTVSSPVLSATAVRWVSAILHRDTGDNWSGMVRWCGAKLEMLRNEMVDFQPCWATTKYGHIEWCREVWKAIS